MVRGRLRTRTDPDRNTPCLGRLLDDFLVQNEGKRRGKAGPAVTPSQGTQRDRPSARCLCPRTEEGSQERLVPERDGRIGVPGRSPQQGREIALPEMVGLGVRYLRPLDALGGVPADQPLDVQVPEERPDRHQSLSPGHPGKQLDSQR